MSVQELTTDLAIEYQIFNNSLLLASFNVTFNATKRPVVTLGEPLGGEIRIAFYSVIFFLSVVGNILVIVTLAQNRRMQTVTNVFLLSLSVSDLLLAVFCMPFTLIPTLLGNFIFGKTMCIMIRYLQGVSVGASVFTLVAISLERYFAICHPLRSRSWQTLSHSYKSIVLVWVIAFLVMIPIAIYQRLWPLRNGAHKCVEVWNSPEGEKAYTLFLDLVLLVFPLILMLLAYGLISWTLWKGMKLEINSTQEMKKLKHYSSMTDDEGDTDEDNRYGNGTTSGYRRNCAAAKRKLELRHHHHMRHSNTERSLIAKKRVIRMLFVVVLEFFICWTPLYVLQTWLVFDFPSARQRVSPLAMNFIHLLSYVSSCCNPITYCFMNKKFRQGFLSAFRCCGYRTRILRKPSDSIGLSQRTVVSSFRSHDVYVDSVIEKSTYD